MADFKVVFVGPAGWWTLLNVGPLNVWNEGTLEGGLWKLFRAKGLLPSCNGLTFLFSGTLLNPGDGLGKP